MQVSTKMYVVTVVIETWENEKKKHTPSRGVFLVGLCQLQDVSALNFFSLNYHRFLVWPVIVKNRCAPIL